METSLMLYLRPDFGVAPNDKMGSGDEKKFKIKAF